MIAPPAAETLGGSCHGASEQGALRSPAIARSAPCSSRLVPWWLPKASEAVGPRHIWCTGQLPRVPLKHGEDELRRSGRSDVRMLGVACGPRAVAVRTGPAEGRTPGRCGRSRPARRRRALEQVKESYADPTWRQTRSSSARCKGTHGRCPGAELWPGAALARTRFWSRPPVGLVPRPGTHRTSTGVGRDSGWRAAGPSPPTQSAISHTLLSPSSDQTRRSLSRLGASGSAPDETPS